MSEALPDELQDTLQNVQIASLEEKKRYAQAAVAAAGILTTALGETYILVMSAVFKGEMSTKDLETEEGKKKIKELFKEQLSISGKKSKESDN